jgi:hypothetical protein
MSSNINTEGFDQANEEFRVESSDLEVPSLGEHIRRQGFKFGVGATLQVEDQTYCGSKEDTQGVESDDQFDDLSEDDPELNYLRHVRALEESGQLVGDDTLSPKGMDNAEVLAGLRDPD